MLNRNLLLRCIRILPRFKRTIPVCRTDASCTACSTWLSLWESWRRSRLRGPSPPLRGTSPMGRGKRGFAVSTPNSSLSRAYISKRIEISGCAPFNDISNFLTNGRQGVYLVFKIIRKPCIRYGCRVILYLFLVDNPFLA